MKKRRITALILSIMMVMSTMPSLVFALDNEPAVSNDVPEVSEEFQAEEDEALAPFDASQTVDGVRITVKAEEGVFPVGSTLSVRKVTTGEEKKAEAAVESKRDENANVATSYTFDIKVLDKDGNEIQPAEGKKVEVLFTAEEIANQNLETSVYHIKEEGGLAAESLDTTEKGDIVAAETDGFSYYTVEFTYGDLQYVMDGDSEIPFSIILDKIGLSGTVTAATSSNPELFSVENNGGAWTVKANQAFCSEESLTLTIDGIDYVIKVTDDVTDDPHNHNHGTGWTAWNNTTSLPTSGKYYLNTNVTLSGSVYFNNSVELCLNGHTITMTGNGQFIGPATNKTLTIYDEPGNSGGIVLKNNRFSVNGVFNLYGGTVKGCTRSYEGALTVSSDGTFNMYGGVFSGNTSGAVLQTSEPSSRLNIYGGEITDNTVYYAPVYTLHGTTTISGGTISGNKGNDGAVYASGNGKTYISGGIIKDNIGKRAAVLVGGLTSLYLSGNVQISGNKLEKNGEECNVKLDSNNYRINISGELTNTTPIGITVYKPPTGDNTVELTKGLNGKGTAANFSSDNPNCAVTIKNNEAHLVNHSHTFNYTAAGDTIIAECVNTTTPCSLTDNKTTLTIVKPALAKYGGTESAEATFEGAIPGVTPTAEYYKGTEKLDAAPTNAGTYKAQVTLKGSDEKEATAFVDYTIEKADISPVVNIEGWNYGDTPNDPSVTAASNPGSGAVTYKYFTDEACTTETSAAQGAEEDGGVPKKGGDYWVQATVKETDNYKSGTGTKKFTIATKAITATGLKYDSKVYDGNTDATLDISEAQLVDVQTGDDVRIKSATGTFDNKNVGTGKTIGSIVIELEGDDAGGYSATADPATVTGVITPCPVTVSGITAEDKTYDGNTTVTLDCTKATIENVATGETLGVSATGTFSDKNVANDKTVTLSDMALTGETAGNYSLTADCQKDTTASISPKALKVSGITAENKIYDGKREANINTGSASYDGNVAGDDVEVDITSAEANFSDKNVGTGKTVTVTFSLSGKDKDNYTATLDGEVKGDITPKSVKVGGITVNERQYDKTTDAPLNTGNATFDGIEDGDVLTVTGTGTYEDANVGEGKTATITGLTLGGTDKDNYTVAADSQKESTGNITQREVKVRGITAKDKPYDGNTNAELDLDGVTLEGNLDEDDLSVDKNKIKGAFEDENVGTGKTVNISGYELTGSAKANYKLAADGQQTQTTASITPKSSEGIEPTQKEGERLTYDGTEKKPTLVVKDDETGKDLREGEDYEVEYIGVEPTEYGRSDIPPTKEGDYIAVIKFKGNYEGEPKEVKFTVYPKPNDTLLAQMTAKGKKSMVIRWTKVDGADGYDIFFSKCNAKGKKYTPKLIKTVRGNGTFKYTKKKLKKRIAYKGYVRAFKMEGGKKKYISKSLMYHGFTSGYKGKYTDAKSVSVKQPNVSLSAGQTSKISASIKKVKSKKKLIKTTHAPHLRYVSSNPYVATVDGSGVITAKGNGSCYVYAVATNGVRAAVAVTVK